MRELTEIDGTPLFSPDPRPRYADIRAEHIEPAVRRVLSEQSARLQDLSSVATPGTAWLKSLESVYEAVNHVWSPVSHLNAVNSSPALRDAYNACIPVITDFYTDLGQNAELYKRFVALRDSGDLDDPVVRQIVRLGRMSVYTSLPWNQSLSPPQRCLGHA